MSQAAPAITRNPADVVRTTPVSQAPNGICYAATGELTITEADLERMVAAVPRTAAAALERKAYYFVPLTVSQGDDIVLVTRDKTYKLQGNKDQLLKLMCDKAKVTGRVEGTTVDAETISRAAKNE